MFTFCCIALASILVTGGIVYATEEEKARAEKVERLKERNKQLDNVLNASIINIIKELKLAKEMLDKSGNSFYLGGYVVNGFPLNETGARKLVDVKDNIDKYIQKFESVKKTIETEISENKKTITKLS